MGIRVVFYMLPERTNEKIIYLCALCVLSEAPQGRDRRAVKIYIIKRRRNEIHKTSYLGTGRTGS